MTTHDLGPAPDLASYGTGMGAEYEWLLSDHPWAAAERVRRASDFYAAELNVDPEPAQSPQVGEPHPIVEEEISGVPEELAESVGGLAEAPAEPIADPHQLPYAAGDAEPDDVAVLRRRAEYVEYRRAHGEPDYQYPESYVGAQAADHLPPGVGPV